MLVWNMSWLKEENGMFLGKDWWGIVNTFEQQLFATVNTKGRAKGNWKGTEYCTCRIDVSYVRCAFGRGLHRIEFQILRNVSSAVGRKTAVPHEPRQTIEKYLTIWEPPAPRPRHDEKEKVRKSLSVASRMTLPRLFNFPSFPRPREADSCIFFGMFP